MSRGPRQGPKRLGLLLSCGSGSLCLAMMAFVLAAYGTPYNPIWWPVMAAIAVASVLVPLLVVPAVDWVIAGYRNDMELGGPAGRGSPISDGRSPSAE